MTVTCPAGHESATDDYCDVCGAALGASGAPVPSPPPVDTAAARGGRACANCGAAHEPGDAFCEVCGLDFSTGELPQPPPPPEAVVSRPDSGAAPDGEAGTEAVGAEEVAGESDAQADEAAAEEVAADEAAGESPATSEEEKEEEEPSGPPPPPPAPPAPGDWYVVVEPDHDWYERNEAEGTTGAVVFPEDTSPWQLTLAGEEILIGRRSETRTAQPDLEIEDPGVSRRHAVLRRQADGGWVVVDESSTNGTWVDGATDPIAAGQPAPLSEGSTVHIGAFTRLTIRKA